MIFASVSTLSAAGGILAHSQNVAGRRWAKGRVLLPADVAAAAAAGIAALTIARLGADDIAENAAAAQLAATLAGPAVTALAATHGRVNLAAG